MLSSYKEWLPKTEHTQKMTKYASEGKSFRLWVKYKWQFEAQSSSLDTATALYLSLVLQMFRGMEHNHRSMFWGVPWGLRDAGPLLSLHLLLPLLHDHCQLWNVLQPLILEQTEQKWERAASSSSGTKASKTELIHVDNILEYGSVYQIPYEYMQAHQSVVGGTSHHTLS